MVWFVWICLQVLSGRRGGASAIDGQVEAFGGGGGVAGRGSRSAPPRSCLATPLSRSRSMIRIPVWTISRAWTCPRLDRDGAKVRCPHAWGPLADDDGIESQWTSPSTSGFAFACCVCMMRGWQLGVDRAGSFAHQRCGLLSCGRAPRQPCHCLCSPSSNQTRLHE